jgi:hypothetical protein
MPVYNVVINRTSYASFAAVISLFCAAVCVWAASGFSVIHCGSFYGKYNKLPMDEDAIRRELEHSGDD